MQYETEQLDGGVLVVKPDGELTMAATPDFLRYMEQIVDAGHQRVVVDCTFLDAISTTGLTALLRLHKRMAERGGQVRLACIKGLVRDALKVMKLDRIFEVYPTVDDARRAMFQ